MTDKQITKPEGLNELEERAIKTWTSALKIDREMAINLLVSDKEKTRYNELSKTQLALDLDDLIKETRKSIKLKLKKGSSGQAKDLGILLGILVEKRYGKEEVGKKSVFSVSNSDVQIRLQWVPKWMKNKGKVIEND